MKHEADVPPLVQKQPVPDDTAAEAILHSLGCDRMHRSSGCGYLHVERCRPRAIESINSALAVAYDAGWVAHSNHIGDAEVRVKAEKLQRALFFYGQHSRTCKSQRWLFKRPCDCGLEKLKEIL